MNLIKSAVNSIIRKDISYADFVWSEMTIATVLILLILPFYLMHCYADQLTNALQQRIGNYNIQLKTEPNIPITNETTKITLRIGSVNGDEIVDLPVIIRISKDNVVLSNSTPIFIQYGHYTFSYRFPQAGVYGMNIVIQKDPSSNQDIIFTFPINISNRFAVFFYTYSYPLLFIGAAGIAITIFAGVVHKKNSRSVRPDYTN
jgi:hypothetical protein